MKIIFTHIPKTGGTTAKKFLFHKNIEKEYIAEFNGLKSFLMNGGGGWKFYGEHCPYGIHKLDTDFSSEYVYVTILRNPIDHACSYYKDSIRWYDLIEEGEKPSPKTFRRARLANKNSLVDFFSYRENQNLQTRLLSGLLMSKIGKYINLNYSLIGSVYSMLAKYNLGERFRVVGKTRNMKDFFANVSEEFGIDFEKVKVSNRGGGGNYEQKLTDNQVKKIEEYNSLDLEVYNDFFEIYD